MRSCCLRARYRRSWCGLYAPSPKPAVLLGGRRRLGAHRNLDARRPSRIAYRGRIDCNKFEASVAPAWQPMFERRDHMMPVAAERAMIAVMKHNDVAMRAARARGSHQPRDQTLWRLRLPVPTNPRPHHDPLHVGAANLSIQQRAAIAVRRPHPARRVRTRGGGNGLLATRQLFANPRARLKY